MARPNSPTGYIAPIALCCGAGLLVCSFANALSREGMEPPLLYWAGILVVALPIFWRLTSREASPAERLALVCLLGLSLYAVKVVRDAPLFSFSDEPVHAFNADQIVNHHHLFHFNPILPVTPNYPGLEGATSALMGLTGLSSYGAGIDHRRRRPALADVGAVPALHPRQRLGPHGRARGRDLRRQLQLLLLGCPVLLRVDRPAALRRAADGGGRTRRLAAPVGARVGGADRARHRCDRRHPPPHLLRRRGLPHPARARLLGAAAQLELAQPVALRHLRRAAGDRLALLVASSTFGYLGAGDRRSLRSDLQHRLRRRAAARASSRARVRHPADTAPGPRRRLARRRPARRRGLLRPADASGGAIARSPSR